MKAAVQVCLAEYWTLGVSVYTSVSAHSMESFCLSWGMPCASALAGCAGSALLAAAGSVCACVFLYVYVCACVRLLPQLCWCLHKETWQKDNTIR